MDRSSQRFDRQLFALKLQELSHEMQRKSLECDRGAFAKDYNSALGGSPLLRLVNGQVALLREWLDGMARIAREVAEIQGEELSLDFVRGELLQRGLQLIAARKGTVGANLERHSRYPHDASAARGHLARELNKLAGELRTRSSIEARTLEHKELRKTKHKVLPTPVRPLNTSGGIRLSRGPTPSSAGGLKPLHYPHEFPSEARDRIEREKIRACRELLPASAYEFKDQELAIRCIMRIFLTFAQELCVFRNEHGWPLDRIQREGEEFLRKLTITVVFEKFPGCDRHWISNWNGSVEPDMEHRFKASPEWTQYEELLLADSGLADGTDTEVATRVPAQNSGTIGKGIENKPAGRPREPVRVENNQGTTTGSEKWRRGAEPPVTPDFVNFSLPPNSSGADLIQEIAKQLGWSIERLPEQFKELSYIRGRTVFGSARDVLDEIAAQYPNMYWAANDGILRFAALNTPVEQSPSPRVENNGETANAVENARQLFVRPILEKKGWSVHQFAVEAQVDFHTANDYLKGKTKPNRASRAQMAKALGVPVEDLPR